MQKGRKSVAVVFRVSALTHVLFNLFFLPWYIALLLYYYYNKLTLFFTYVFGCLFGYFGLMCGTVELVWNSEKKQ